MNKTITLQIGNSDDKLTQVQWSEFVERIRRLIWNYSANGFPHFDGGAPNDQRWQNYCWVFELEEMYFAEVRAHLTSIRKNFKQDSIAWIEGETEFI